MKPINNEQTNNNCVCPTCPLFNECSIEKKDSAFCAKTKSLCIKEAKDACACGSCPIFLENNLSGGYFCINEITE